LRTALTCLLCATLLACERPKPAATAPAAPSVQESVSPAPRQSEPPPDVAASVLLSGAPSDTLDVASVSMGRLNLLLGRTRIPDVLSQIGAGVVDEQGDGADWKSWVCYTIPGVERVWLISGPQGSGDFVGSISAAIDPTAQPEPHCPALPAAYRPIAIYPDVWLRTAPTRVDRLFGANQTGADGWRVYTRQRHRREDNLEFDENNTLALRFENGRVVQLRASKQVIS
ncbi:MAG: hypothetical protein ABUS48_04955, partial [Pseudomonadota bacterium]